MERRSLILVFAMAMAVLCHGQEQFTILESDQTHMSLRFDLGDFSIDTLRCNGELMHTLSARGIVAPNEYGQPDLPTFNCFVAIPQGATPVVEVKTTRDEVRTGMNIAPSYGSQCENEEDLPLFRDSRIYSANAFFPEQTVYQPDPQSLRGVDVVHLGLCPFQYNPVTKALAIHRQMDIEIRFEGGNGYFGDDRLRSPYWDPILRNNILNYDCLPPIDYDARMQQWSLNRATGCEYLILTPDNDAFYDAAQELANYRLRQGILTKVMRVTETGATDATSLRLWFRNIYANWEIPPVAVCIVGESGDDLQSYVPAFRTKHPKDNFIASDNPYADVNDDYLPDICFTRLIAQNESELPIFIGKQIEYEYTQPVMDPYYYGHPLTAAAWQTSKWFQITIATISGFLAQHAKMPTRINAVYDGEPGDVWSSAAHTNSITSYFGPEGMGYIPSTPDQLGGWTNGTADQVITTINEGAYLVQHRDHGWNTKWYQPEIYVSDFTGINNPGLMTYLISINCRTGMYNESTTCFTEALIRMTRNGQNAGVVGAISPTGQTYSFGNDIYLWGVWDLFDSGFLPEYGPYADHPDAWMPSFANVSGKYFLGHHVFPGANELMFSTTCNTFHNHGDAFLRLFTEVPQPVQLEHDQVVSCFTPFHITAPAGAQIALTTYRDGQVHILATAIATGQEQTLTVLESINSESIHLTVTGLNLLRHEEEITLEPITRPFVVVDSIALNGGDLTLAYDQSVLVDILVTNVGQGESTEGVATLSSMSSQITINQDETSFASLSANSSQLLEDAFSFDIADGVGDGNNIPIGITTLFGDESYTRYYLLHILSPDLKAELLSINDDAGNGNGRLDPGEYATLTFCLTNSGHFMAASPSVSLYNDEGYVRVVSQPQSLQDLEVGESAMVSMDVFVEYAAGLVPMVELTLRSCVKGLVFDQPFALTVGYVLENFEQGTLPAEFWTNDPEHPWMITNDYAYEGSFSIKSDTITHNETSSLTFTYRVFEEGVLSFYSMVSTELNYDFLTFSIDEEEVDRWSGELHWEEHSYELQPGLHTFTWTYLKDHSVNYGLDAVWIDFIQLPFHPDEVANSSDSPLTLRPNPTNGMVYLDMEGEGFVVRVFDEAGRLVLSERDAKTFSLAGLSPGIYHVVVEQEGQRWSRKVIKL